MTSSNLIVVGHRGALTAAPENTMASFLAARELGADAVELDVHQSRDGELVVHHNYTLDQTTTGHGPIFEHDWVDLARLDAGRWFSEAFEGERIPRLADVLAIDGLEFEVELKGYGETMVDRALATVETAGMLDRVEFTSGNVSLLAELRRRQPEATTGLFTPRYEPWMTPEVFEHCIVGLARHSTSQVVHVQARSITARIVDRLQGLDKTVHANDAKNPADVERAIHAGASRLSANDVEMAVTARNRHRPAASGSIPQGADGGQV